MDSINWPIDVLPAQEAVPTLRSLWSNRWQVLLSYEDQSAARYPDLWPAIPYWWANQPTAQGVIKYLDWKKAMGRPGESQVHCVEYTWPR